jgi:hypothetical protein
MKEPDPKSTIWRYMNFPKFINLLQQSELFFCRLDKLSDQLEGTLPSKFAGGLYKEVQKNLSAHKPYISQREIDEKADKRVKTPETFKKYTLVNCWSIDEEESFALWKLYLGCQPYGVAILTKYENLKKSFMDESFSILFGMVYYDNDKVQREQQSSVPFRKSMFDLVPIFWTTS